MKRVTVFLIVTAFAASATGADKKADELLAKARAAIGGDRVARIQGLSMAGTISRSVGERTLDGDLSVDIQLPDRMLRTDSLSPMGDSVTVVQEQGFAGDTLLRFSKILNAGPGMMIRTPPVPAAGTPEEAQQLRNSRSEFARLAIGLLLTSPKALPVEFTYGGEAESPEGKADVIDGKGEGAFLVKLYLDQKSHRPLMLGYRGVNPQIRVQTQTARREGTAPAASGGREGDHGGPAAAASPETVDITMFFDDYKSVDGVMLPHRLSRSVDGKTTEEWTFKTIKVNPSFKADTFAKK